MIAPRLLSTLAFALILGGCASSKSSTPSTVFDFGPALPAAQGAAAAPASMPAIVVMDATGAAILDNERMYYRLNYADALQARTYANSRWSGNPLALVTQRVKTRLAQSGMKVLSATDASTGVPILRIEVDELMHSFSGAAQSEGQLALRASVFNEHRLVDQRSFSRTTPAASADAAGGARALAQSLDATSADILAWLATLPVTSPPTVSK
ncbi:MULTISPECIES: ABC-type transport auxiliary lipoprotein family protein [unclassified Massilia]|uniref:ABC-type transport auxiliary lipoprotein family protein n=1 Tax=unclassified Massilia TaxID=2609279 RepID=UPI001E623A98|nr:MULTISPECIES: ABC-type transport auxiliary lipoprotein family protein [unclassified Massilia]